MTINRIRVVAGLAVNAQGEILLGKRRPEMKRGDQWETPGGKVDLAEGDAHALIREWQEELSVTPTVHHRVARVKYELEDPVVFSLYHVKLNGQVPRADEAHTEVRWVAPLEACHKLACSPGFWYTYALIRDFVSGLSAVGRV